MEILFANVCILTIGILYCLYTKVKHIHTIVKAINIGQDFDGAKLDRISVPPPSAPCHQPGMLSAEDFLHMTGSRFNAHMWRTDRKHPQSETINPE